MSNFFTKCSGANLQILNKCPTEKVKFAGIGATIFTTALLASVSGGYAIYFTFNNFYIALIFGIIWGFIIFNLDRYIVSSIRKSDVFSKQLITAAPRLLIAVVLAITISKPLELQLFNGTILKRMGEKEDQYNKSCEEGFIKMRNKLDVNKSSLLNELNEKKNSLYKNDPIYNDLEKQVTDKEYLNQQLLSQIDINRETILKNSWLEDVFTKGRQIKIRRYNETGKSMILENRRMNSQVETNKESINTLRDSLNNRKQNLSNQVINIEVQYGAQIAGIQNQIDSLNKKRPAILEKCEKEAALDTDILSRLSALSDLKEVGNTVWWASTMITLLFILIETAPIIVKLIAKRGPYDEILDRIEYEIYLDQQKIISEKNNEANIFLEEIKATGKLNIDIRLKVEQARFDAELKANEELLSKIAAKQVSLAEKMVNHWYEEEEKNLSKGKVNLQSQ